MNTLKLMEVLKKYTLFSNNDLGKILKKDRQYIWQVINRLLSKKLIYKIERGKYTTYNDALIFSSHIVYPSYLSLWTGFRFHDLTTQLPNKIFVCAAKSKKSIRFEGTDIIFIKNKHMWGYNKYRYNDFDIFVSDPEKTIIDSLLTGSVPLHEVIPTVNRVNSENLIKYAEKTKNISLIKRVGYLLDINKKQADKLLIMVTKPLTVLDINLPKKGVLNKKWALVINNKEALND